MKAGKSWCLVWLSLTAFAGCDDSDDAPREDASEQVIGDDADDTGADEDDGGGPDDGSDASLDAGDRPDADAPKEAGTKTDAGTSMDAGTMTDAGDALDAARTPDGAAAADSAAPDAADGDGGEPSAACVACEQTACTTVETLDGLFDYTKYCDDLGDALATEGPGEGQPKRELCHAYLRCARRTGCANGTYGVSPDVACFCGELATDDCIAMGAASVSSLPGPCVLEALAAAEALEAQQLFERSTNYMNYALGAATYLLQCDVGSCADECYMACAGEPDGTLCGASGGGADAFNERGQAPYPSSGTCQAGACVDNQLIQL